MREHRVLSVLVEDKPGVLARVSSLLARRGFNIHSLAVGPTADAGLSTMTIVVMAAELEQAKKQLHKLVNVVKITELDPATSIEREIILVKINATSGRRGEVIDLARIFNATPVDVAVNSITLLMAASPPSSTTSWISSVRSGSWSWSSRGASRYAANPRSASSRPSADGRSAERQKGARKRIRRGSPVGELPVPSRRAKPFARALSEPS